jgi:fatty-acyl-CoA synthase
MIVVLVLARRILSQERQLFEFAMSHPFEVEGPHRGVWPRRVPAHLPPIHTTLWDNLDITRRRYPDKDAVVFLGARIVYRSLYERCELLAGWLQHRAGVRPGDRVVLALQNSLQYVVSFYAVLRAQGVVVTANPMARRSEYEHYVRDSGARVAICAADVLPQLLSADVSLDAILVARYTEGLEARGGAELDIPPQWRSWLDTRPESLPPNAHGWADALAAELRPNPYQGRVDDLMLLGYTSGTTGQPKGCMHSHRSVGHNVVAGPLWSGACMADVVLSVLPLYHITGMQSGMNIPIYTGGTMVLMPRWDRDVAGALISRYRVSSWGSISTMLIDLLAAPDSASFDLSSLRYIGGGGAAMPRAIAERLRDQYGLNYIEGYGLTETAAPCHSNPLQAPRPQCLGVPYIGVVALVIDPDTLTPLGPGQTGEIVIHGPQVFKGYWQRPAETEEVFIEINGRRFFRTGDLGQYDDQGYYTMVDRLKRMINASGLKVWPAEVENIMFAHPAIQEVCVIGARDPYRGETVKALIVPRPGREAECSAVAIEQWARERMAAYKVPRQVELVPSLPRSPAGKVLWRELQERQNLA